MFVLFLQQCGYKAFGYDPYVEKYSDKKVLENRYDIVTSYEALEHANQPVEFFEQIAHCVRQGSLIAIETPNADEIDLQDPVKFALELHQPYHRHILSEKSLINLGLKRGLEVVKIYHRFYFDTLYPMVNTRLLKSYVRITGNFLMPCLKNHAGDLYSCIRSFCFTSLPVISFHHPAYRSILSDANI